MEFKKEFIKATKVYVILTVISCLIEFLFGNNFTWDEVKQWIIINILFTYPFYFSNGYLNEYLDKVMPWRENPKRRAIMGTIITIIMNVVVIYCIITLVTVTVFKGPLNYVFTPNGKSMVLTTLVIVTIISLLFYSIGFFKEVQEERVINEKLRKEKATAELDALKAQVNPHFLFNSFNVLSGLIDENPDQAQVFLKRLSKTYRHLLESRDEAFISLQEELKFAKEYIALQQIRFEEGIQLNIDVNEDQMDKKVPALSLQLLMENAIKHNAFDKDSPLRIEMMNQNGHLLITNNKKHRSKLSEGSGMGLENIRKRYELNGENGFEVDDSASHFTVKLPLL